MKYGKATYGSLRVLTCYKCGGDTYKYKQILNPVCYGCFMSERISWRTLKSR